MSIIKNLLVRIADFRRNSTVNVPLREDALTKKSIYRFRMVTTGYYVIVILAFGLVFLYGQVPETETTHKAVLIAMLGVLMLFWIVCCIGSFADNLAERFRTSRDFLDEWEKDIEARSHAFFGRALLNIIIFIWLFVTYSQLAKGENRREIVDLSFDPAIMTAGFAPIIIGLVILPNLYVAWAVKPIDNQAALK